MKIQRNRSRFTLRPRRHKRGFLPLTVLVMLLIGVVMGSRNWLVARLSGHAAPQSSTSFRVANRAFDEGDLNAAINLTRQIWTTHPEQTQALTLLVRSLIYRSYADYNRDVDRKVALQLTAEAVKRYPDQPAVMTAYAFALQANEKSIEAWNIASNVLDRDPGDTLARITLALAYGGIGGHENALRESQAATAAGEWRLDALRALAISLNNLGRHRDAVEAVEAAIAINNKLMVLHFEQARYALQMGDTDRATVAYFHVLAFDPDNIKVRLRMCELSSLLSDHNTALDYCREVTGRAPGWVEGWRVQGRTYYLRGDFSAAQQAFHRCTTLAVWQDIPVVERPFECWYLQGQAAETLGDCDGLLATYNEFQAMAAQAPLPQTWTYPPEGPPMCVTVTPNG